MNHRAKSLGTAFTLIEVLVVVAIVGILAALLFPVFSQARVAAKQSADAALVRQVGLAMTLYRDDHDGVYPMNYYVGRAGQTQPDNRGLFRWPWLVYPYAKSFDVFFSPADAEGAEVRDRQSASFGYLFGLVPSWGYNGENFSPTDQVSGEFQPQSESRNDSPANTLLLASSLWGTNPSSPKSGYYRLYPPDEWAGAPPLTGLSYGHVWPRHRGRFATVFHADGHVAFRTIEQVARISLWTLEDD
ncbi:MAG: type II secretion system protein [Fimbriimonadaceae bacterium]